LEAGISKDFPSGHHQPGHFHQHCQDDDHADERPMFELEDERDELQAQPDQEYRDAVPRLHPFLNRFSSSSIALNSMALPSGSSMKRLRCSPTSPFITVLGPIRKGTPTFFSLSRRRRQSAKPRTMPQWLAGTWLFGLWIREVLM